MAALAENDVGARPWLLRLAACGETRAWRDALELAVPLVSTIPLLTPPEREDARRIRDVLELWLEVDADEEDLLEDEDVEIAAWVDAQRKRIESIDDAISRSLGGA